MSEPKIFWTSMDHLEASAIPPDLQDSSIVRVVSIYDYEGLKIKNDSYRIEAAALAEANQRLKSKLELATKALRDVSYYGVVRAGLIHAVALQKATDAARAALNELTPHPEPKENE